MRLVDQYGRPLPTERDKEYAQKSLQEFLEKHKRKCVEWIQEHGQVRFPVQFNVDKKQWEWIGDT